MALTDEGPVRSSNETPNGLDKSDFRTSARTLVVGCLLLLASVGVARLFLGWLQSQTPPREWALASGWGNRGAEIVKQLPNIVGTQGPVAVLIGSSTTVFGYSPVEFDKEMGAAKRSLTTYNLGIAGARATDLSSIARRLNALCQEKHRKLDMAIVNFAPLAGTKFWVARRRGKVATEAMVKTGSEFAQLALESPSDATSAFGIVLLGRVAPETAAKVITRRVFETNANEDLSDPTRGILRGGQCCTWDVAGRGVTSPLIWTSAQAKAAYDREVQKSYAAPFGQFPDRELPNHELIMDEEAVSIFIRVVRESRSFANNVYVVVTPINRDLAEPTPDGRARLEATLARIQNEAGVKVLDFSMSSDYSKSDDFYDDVHLNEYGRIKFSKHVAREILAQTSR
ncbi:MAG: hypothetical protein ACKVPX_03095 [Myxococcaceae bacterium]